MELGNSMLSPEDVGGVYPLLVRISGYAAMERGSESIELRDFVKAIYIADLEHVAPFWRNWEGFEKLVAGERLRNGRCQTYINRTLYLLRIEVMSERSEGSSFIGLGKPSAALLRVIASARKLASERAETPATPSSRDFLFCICADDAELSAELEKSGLRIDSLAATVRPGRGPSFLG
jgi:hypothetical protein